MSVDQEDTVKNRLPNIKYRKSNNLTTLDNESKDQSKLCD